MKLNTYYVTNTLITKKEHQPWIHSRLQLQCVTAIVFELTHAFQASFQNMKSVLIKKKVQKSNNFLSWNVFVSSLISSLATNDCHAYSLLHNRTPFLWAFPGGHQRIRPSKLFLLRNLLASNHNVPTKDRGLVRETEFWGKLRKYDPAFLRSRRFFLFFIASCLILVFFFSGLPVFLIKLGNQNQIRVWCWKNRLHTRVIC